MTTKERKEMAARRRIAKQDVLKTRKEIGAAMVKLRGKMSQEALEALSTVNRRQIGHIENGKNDYQIDTLLKILAALKADAIKELIMTPLEDELSQQLRFIMRAARSEVATYVMTTVQRESIAAGYQQQQGQLNVVSADAIASDDRPNSKWSQRKIGFSEDELGPMASAKDLYAEFTKAKNVSEERKRHRDDRRNKER